MFWDLVTVFLDTAYRMNCNKPCVFRCKIFIRSMDWNLIIPFFEKIILVTQKSIWEQ